VDGAVFVEQRPMEGREVDAVPDAVIGREGTDIVLADPEVSRRHAAVRSHEGGIAIEDLGSTNGTFVNDRRVSGTVALSDGDIVRLGNTVWRVKAPVAAAGATMVGQVPPAAPQVTAARPVPSDLRPPSNPPTTPQPAAAAAPVQQPAAPSAPTPAAVGPRGDVPAPPEVAPSAIRRVLPPPTTGAVAFSPPGQRQITSKRGSAATRVEATLVCLVIVVAVAVAVVVYFAAQ
jgi:predicted component of type VI protein secretion system